MTHAPLVLEFTPGTRIRETTPSAELEILTREGEAVALPADQVVWREERAEGTRIGIGGMSFEGTAHDNRLVLWRVRDLLPEELLSPQRAIKVLLDPKHVSAVLVQGSRVWPSRER